jgi:IS30 family transposase
MKNDKRQNQRNDLTLEIKERIKEYQSRVKSRTNSRCLLKKGLSCVSTESIYQHIWKIKEKGICI